MRFSPKREGFLHPVLGQRDYHWPNGKFESDINSKIDRRNGKLVLVIDANFNLTVESINQLIDQDEAICAVWVYCQKTAYRTLLKADDHGDRRRIRYEIPERYLRGNVELHPQVIASRKVRLSLAEAHSVYGNSWCEVPAGAPLATHPPTITGLEDDDMTIRSMFRLTVDGKYGNSWHVDADIDYITVTLSVDEDTKSWFDQQRYKTTETFTGTEWAVQTLYLAALTETLTLWLQHYEQDTEWRSGGWCSAVSRQLEVHDIQVQPGDDSDPATFRIDGDYRSPIWVAQRLLGKPLQRPLTEGHDQDI